MSVPAPYIGVPDPEKKPQPVARPPVEIVEQPEIKPTLVERRGKTWYKKLSLSVKSNVKSTCSSIIPESPEIQVITMEEYLNKPLPLPPRPSPQLPPYFEYMFSDAGFDKKKSNEAMKSSAEIDSNAQGKSSPQSPLFFADKCLADLDQQETTQAHATNSSGSSPSYGLNSTEITSFAFAQAGVNVSAKGMKSQPPLYFQYFTNPQTQKSLTTTLHLSAPVFKAILT